MEEDEDIKGGIFYAIIATILIVVTHYLTKGKIF